jgi:hypothetical protein
MVDEYLNSQPLRAFLSSVGVPSSQQLLWVSCSAEVRGGVLLPLLLAGSEGNGLRCLVMRWGRAKAVADAGVRHGGRGNRRTRGPTAVLTCHSSACCPPRRWTA